MAFPKRLCRTTYAESEVTKIPVGIRYRNQIGHALACVLRQLSVKMHDLPGGEGSRLQLVSGM